MLLVFFYSMTVFFWLTVQKALQLQKHCRRHETQRQNLKRYKYTNTDYCESPGSCDDNVRYFLFHFILDHTDVSLKTSSKQISQIIRNRCGMQIGHNSYDTFYRISLHISKHFVKIFEFCCGWHLAKKSVHLA